MKKNKLILIDGNSLINRAYFAIKAVMTSSDGTPTNAIYGFLNMLFKVKKDFDPTHILVAFDKKGETFRHKTYKDYKAGRRKMDPSLFVQFPIIKEILDAMNIKTFEIEGFEADDIIGTVSDIAKKENLLTYIFTGDRDLLQLIDEDINVVYTKKGVSTLETYDSEKFFAEYGFKKDYFIDYKAIMGDNSDNIIGVAGVGKKTAADLITEYSTVENIFENIDSISEKKKKVGENLRNSLQNVMMNKELVTICKNVPIDFSIDDLELKEYDNETLFEIYDRLDLNKFKKSLEDSISEPLKKDFKKEKKNNIEFNDDVIVLDNLDNLNLGDDIYLKIFTNYDHMKKPIIRGISFSTKGKYYYISNPSDVTISDFVELISKKNIIGYDLKREIYSFSYYSKAKFNSIFDIAIFHNIYYGYKSPEDVTEFIESQISVEIQKEKDFLKETIVDLFEEYKLKEGQYLYKILKSYEHIYSDFKEFEIEDNLKKDLESTEYPLVSILADIEKEGISVDESSLDDIIKILEKDLICLEENIWAQAGEEFNINSPSQMANILFEKLGLKPLKKNKNGYSTDIKTLESLKGKSPIIDYILDYRIYAKLNQTYGSGMKKYISDDKKIHAQFNQAITTTGRLSCTQPNLQTIPIRREFGRNLRKIFIPSDDNILVGADYSQIELRVLAHMSGDENMIDSFNHGLDIHRKTAASIFNISEDDVTDEERSAAKAINFGIIYGMSDFRLSNEINVSLKDAKKYKEEYFNRFPKVKSFLESQVDSCKKNGYVLSILGRKRIIDEIQSSNAIVRKLGERMALNTPIQASASDIIKMAMVDVANELKKNNLKSKLVLQIHDELIIDTLKEEEEIVKKILKETMENTIDLKVNLVADVKSGGSWYELK